MKSPLSLVITTFDNAATIRRCIASAAFADEVLVLDSFSRDDTADLARLAGARVIQESFRGYGLQKQRAIELARHERILLLDADEVLDEELAQQIEAVCRNHSEVFAYRLRREEWLYWRWPGRGTRLTDHLRLFDRRLIQFGDHPVHAAPEYAGTCPLLEGRLRHYGHHDIAGQLDRINAYTSGGASSSRRGVLACPGLRMTFAPGAAFIREYLFRRQFLNGWAGLIASRMAAWHAFLRHAKRMEHQKNKQIKSDRPEK
jgi:glycosyltransferase involved in cell wall biosynthesis